MGYVKVIDWEAKFNEERAAKRAAINVYVDLVEICRRVALYQTASHARDRAEADMWAKFYRMVNEAPVTFGPGLGALPGKSR